MVAVFMLTGPRPAPTPTALAQSAQVPQAKAAPTLLVLNKAENSLALVDPATMRVVARVATGEGPHEVVTSSDGHTAYVSNYGAEKPGNSLSIIDLASRKETRRVDLGPLLRPHGLVEREGKIYFDAATRKELKRFPVGEAAVGIVVSSDSRRAFVASMATGKVTAVDLTSMTLAGSVETGQAPDGLAWVGE
jgi:YVTN family beta-propeller protein